MQSPFVNQLRQRLDAVHPGVAERLHEIEKLPEEIGRSVLRILVSQACQSQHVGNIQAAREALAMLTPLWLQQVLLSVIPEAMDADDEWEYRRLLELLRDTVPSLVSVFVHRGLASPDLGVREAAVDFAAVVPAPEITASLGQIPIQERKL